MSDRQETANDQSVRDTPRPQRTRSGQKHSIDPGPGDLRYARKRALRACHLCRVRKTKCDNVQPICGSCAAIGSTCRYDDSQKDHSSFDPASLEILRKLGQILAVQNDLMDIVRNGNQTGPSQTTSPVYISLAEPNTTEVTSPHDLEAFTTSWNASQFDKTSYHPGLLSAEHNSPIVSPRNPSLVAAGAYAPTGLTASSETEPLSPVMSGSTATLRWFELLANDAAGAVIQATESDCALDSSFLPRSDHQNDDDMTPLQRATKIVDDLQPGKDLWHEKSASSTDRGLPSRHPEERLWRAEEDISLLPEERYYFKNFLERISKWIDLFDPMNKFSSLVPHLALRNAGLMNAIFALSCRHLSLNPSTSDDAPDRNCALQYYYQTLHYVQRAMRHPTYQSSFELLATTLIISTYEMLDGSRKAWERHLRGACWILRSQITEVESADFKSAIWWAWLRQDVWAAFSEKRKAFTDWTPKKTYGSLTPYELASRSAWIMAQVVNFCSHESSVAVEGTFIRRVQRANELRNMLSEWREHLTVEFSPIPTADDYSGSTVFQPLCVRPPCLGAALQLHHAAQILLCGNEPTSGSIGYYLERQVTIQECIKVVCGVGMTLDDDASSLVSSQCLFIAGMFTQDKEQREFILDLLQSCRQRTGWSPKFLGEDLKQIWSKPHPPASRDVS